MATVAWRVVKPPKLNVKEMNDALNRGMKKTRDTMLKSYKRTVKTWSDKPEFETAMGEVHGHRFVHVWTDDPIYAYVDKGTKEHIILPKRPGGVLAFRGVYKAKTTPGVIDAHGGGSSGPTVYSKGVIHPGNEARGFSEMIEKQMQDEFEQTMGEAATEAAIKSYHHMR